jgi:hypothetical protein
MGGAVMEPKRAKEVLDLWTREAGPNAVSRILSVASPRVLAILEELISDDASASVTRRPSNSGPSGKQQNATLGEPTLLLSGDRGVVELTLIVVEGGPEIKGELLPLTNVPLTACFTETREATKDGQQRMVDRWDFRWPGAEERTMLVEYWAPCERAALDGDRLQDERTYQESQRALALRLARSAGWPLPPEADGEASMPGTGGGPSADNPEAQAARSAYAPFRLLRRWRARPG